MVTAEEVKATVDRLLAAVSMTMGAEEAKSLGFPSRLVDALKDRKGGPPVVREGNAGGRGRGLFATRRVSKGDVLTMYPCDLMRVTGADGSVSLAGGG